jgi:hypothetical protein
LCDDCLFVRHHAAEIGFDTAHLDAELRRVPHLQQQVCAGNQRLGRNTAEI